MSHGTQRGCFSSQDAKDGARWAQESDGWREGRKKDLTFHKTQGQGTKGRKDGLMAS